MSNGLMEALAAGHGSGSIVHLVGHLHVSVNNREITVTEGAARLLAYLAINIGTHERRHVATSLWPDADVSHATANLRTALWRLGGSRLDVVESSRSALGLAEGVLVDIHLMRDWAARVVSGVAAAEDLAHPAWDVECLEILPGWQDDWILLERDRLRQRMLHALEVLGHLLVTRGHCAEAVDVALVAIAADPLRESAQRVLIEACLAEENRAEATRRFDAYRALLHRELGIEPSPQLASLVTGRPSLGI